MESQVKYDIMISYNHESGADYMERLRKELNDRDFKVWVDIEQLSGRLYDGMAKGVAGTHILIPLISKAYNESVNCMDELTQAKKLKKVIIPVKIEKYTPPDASSLSFILNDLIYYKVYEGCDETVKVIDAVNRRLGKCKTDLKPTEGNPTQESVASGNEVSENEDGTPGSSEPDGKGKGLENEDVTSESSQPGSEGKGSENEDATFKSSEPEREEKAASMETLNITDNYDECPITLILDNRTLLSTIACKLESDRESLRTLAFRFDFGTDEISKILCSTYPSHRFFLNLATNQGNRITLKELKRVVEVELKTSNKEIFRKIEEDIKLGNAPVTLESTLNSLISGEKWVYFQENVADKLYENKALLPSWKDVASYYGYTYLKIQDFEKFADNEKRPTFIIFEQLSHRENVPKIASLKNKLKQMQRNDIVKDIDDSFKDQNN